MATPKYALWLRDEPLYVRFVAFCRDAHRNQQDVAAAAIAAYLADQTADTTPQADRPARPAARRPPGPPARQPVAQPDLDQPTDICRRCQHPRRVHWVRGCLAGCLCSASRYR